MKQFFTMVLAERQENTLAQTERATMLQKYRAQEIPGVEWSARVYTHVPNKNHTILNEAELETFASSFIGQPFLKDHSHKYDDRGGTVLDSKLETINGKKVIRQTIQAVTPWAVEGYLNGTIDRYSIGWDAEQYVCTACGTDFLGPDCPHGLFDIGRKDPKTGKTVEILMKGLEGQETSTVTHPAVPGTGNDGTLAQLCQLKEVRADGNNAKANKPKEQPMKERVIALLGLAADTAEPEALAALETRLKAPPAIPTAMLTVLGLKPEATIDQAIAEVVNLKAPGNYVPKSEHEKVADELAEMKANAKVAKGKAEGKITPAAEDWARKFAKDNPAAFDAWIATKPVEVPGRGESGFTPAPMPKTVTLSEDELRGIRGLGMTPEEFLKAKDEVDKAEARHAALYAN